MGRGVAQDRCRSSEGLALLQAISSIYVRNEPVAVIRRQHQLSESGRSFIMGTILPNLTGDAADQPFRYGCADCRPLLDAPPSVVTDAEAGLQRLVGSSRTLRAHVPHDLRRKRNHRHHRTDAGIGLPRFSFASASSMSALRQLRHSASYRTTPSRPTMYGLGSFGPRRASAAMRVRPSSPTV